MTLTLIWQKFSIGLGRKWLHEVIASLNASPS